VTVAYEQLRTPAGFLRRLAAVLTRYGLPLGLITTVAVGLEWVRFGMRTPSLVDDWFGITYAPSAAHALAHGHYGSSPVDVAGRYRPAYTAIWNYAQWHLFGNPSIHTAAVWGAFRTSLLVVAIWLLASWVAGGRSASALPLVWLAPLAVAMTPELALDLTRHGPADPMMVAGLIIGLALIGSGARTLLGPGAGRSKRAVAALAIGYLIYLIGVYSKEASICVIAFLPFFLKWLGPTFRTQMRGSRVGHYLLPTLAVLLVAPLVHVAAHVASAVLTGENPYPNAAFSLGTKVLAAVVFPLVGAPGPLGTFLWLAGAPAAIAFTVVVFRRHDPDAWLLAGVLATGYLMSAFSLVRGDTPSRYYLPWVIAVAAVAVRAFAESNTGLQIAAGVVVVAMALTGTRDAVAGWARTERSGSTAVEMAKAVVVADCPLYLAKFDVERRVAIPRLLSFAHAKPLPRCAQTSATSYALSWKSAPLPPQFAASCRSSWQMLAVRDRVSMYRCASLDAGPIPDQDGASGSPDVAVVRLSLPAREPSPETFTRPPVSSESG
jgi:hypothetical protein